MLKKPFDGYGTFENHKNWEQLTSREIDLYSRSGDIRSPFVRDYTRVLHSMAYRRLKHKTQVFFNINDDHICTRMEHVSHVESVSSTIARNLGLNEELTKAISIGHDLGHAPFGHQGETVIKKLSQSYLHKSFWHEQNGLRFIDKIELLEDNYSNLRHLSLTYAVRDGIISHCGEVDQNGIHPRDISIPLKNFNSPGCYESVTWEGCVVKIADKIAYLGRDIEDASNLGFLDQTAIKKLSFIAQTTNTQVINTTVIMHDLIVDICKNSSPTEGICLSEKSNKILTELKKFNYKYIYKHKRLKSYQNYSSLVINEIFDTLSEFYDGKHTFISLGANMHFTPMLIDSFQKWLARFCNIIIVPEGHLKEMALKCQNEKIYNCLDTKEIYYQAIIDFISGMTDRFAIKLFNELLEY